MIMRESFPPAAILIEVLLIENPALDVTDTVPVNVAVPVFVITSDFVVVLPEVTDPNTIVVAESEITGVETAVGVALAAMLFELSNRALSSAETRK